MKASFDVYGDTADSLVVSAIETLTAFAGLMDSWTFQIEATPQIESYGPSLVHAWRGHVEAWTEDPCP